MTSKATLSGSASARQRYTLILMAVLLVRILKCDDLQEAKVHAGVGDGAVYRVLKCDHFEEAGLHADDDGCAAMAWMGTEDSR